MSQRSPLLYLCTKPVHCAYFFYWVWGHLLSPPHFPTPLFCVVQMRCVQFVLLCCLCCCVVVLVVVLVISLALVSLHFAHVVGGPCGYVYC